MGNEGEGGGYNSRKYVFFIYHLLFSFKLIILYIYIFHNFDRCNSFDRAHTVREYFEFLKFCNGVTWAPTEDPTEACGSLRKPAEACGSPAEVLRKFLKN